MATILLVGDDPPEREVLGLVFEFGGHRCRTAVSVKEAVMLLQQESFDLVVTDVKTAVKRDRSSSTQIAKELKAASAEVAVMILTESGDTAVKGADAIVAIPCSPQLLLQRIEQVLKTSADPAGKRPSHREKDSPAQSPWRRAAKA